MRLSYANIMSTIAVFIALGGTSYAAVQIHGSQIKNRTITQKKLKRQSVGSKEVKDASLKGRDLGWNVVGRNELGIDAVEGQHIHWDTVKMLHLCLVEDYPTYCSMFSNT